MVFQEYTPTCKDSLSLKPSTPNPQLNHKPSARRKGLRVRSRVGVKGCRMLPGLGFRVQGLGFRG